jgi:hypothetical protein
MLYLNFFNNKIYDFYKNILNKTNYQTHLKNQQQ